MSELKKNANILTYGEAATAQIKDTKNAGMLVGLVSRVKKLQGLDDAAGGEHLKNIKKSLLKYYNKNAEYVDLAIQALVDKNENPTVLDIQLSVEHEDFWDRVEIVAEMIREVAEKMAMEQRLSGVVSESKAFKASKASYIVSKPAPSGP
jgi:hypothetical protein